MKPPAEDGPSSTRATLTCAASKSRMILTPNDLKHAADPENELDYREFLEHCFRTDGLSPDLRSPFGRRRPEPRRSRKSRDGWSRPIRATILRARYMVPLAGGQSVARVPSLPRVDIAKVCCGAVRVMTGRYAHPPAATLLTGLGAGEWSPLRSHPYAVVSGRP